MARQQAQITWQAGEVPVSARFDDPYFSLTDGLAETVHVFLAGNDLPKRFRGGFHIAELGFGTGLNFLAALMCWRDAGAPGHLQYTSFEAYPMSRADMARALSAFPALAGPADELLALWQGRGCAAQFDKGVRLEVIEGDARQTLPRWAGQADAWFLDGFSPAKNPELWQPDLLAEVARHTAPGGSAATYSAAGAVRRALTEAGFAVERVPGFGRKRHMTRARMP